MRLISQSINKNVWDYETHKSINSPFSPLFSQIQINLVNRVNFLPCVKILPDHASPQKNLLVSKSINFISMQMSSENTFLQDSFTHVLRNQNANPTLAIVAKKMFGKRHTPISFASFLRSWNVEAHICINLQLIVEDTYYNI